MRPDLRLFCFHTADLECRVPRYQLFSGTHDLGGLFESLLDQPLMRTD
jgi:hypothetical protein